MCERESITTEPDGRVTSPTVADRKGSNSVPPTLEGMSYHGGGPMCHDCPNSLTEKPYYTCRNHHHWRTYCDNLEFALEEADTELDHYSDLLAKASIQAPAGESGTRKKVRAA